MCVCFCVVDCLCVSANLRVCVFVYSVCLHVCCICVLVFVCCVCVVACLMVCVFAWVFVVDDSFVSVVICVVVLVVYM